MEKLEETEPLTPDLYEKRTNLCAELNDILADEELFWLQHSNERWLLKGDQNTAFYHRVANGKKRKNTIHSLTDGKVVSEGTKDLLNHASSYYKELFGPARGNIFHLSPDTWDEGEKLRPSLATTFFSNHGIPKPKYLNTWAINTSVSKKHSFSQF